MFVGAATLAWMLWLYDPLEETRDAPENKTIESHPTHLPKNFKNAPQKIECAVEKNSSNFSANFYLNKNESWLLVTLEKSGKDMYIYFQKNLKDEEGDGVAIEEWANKDGHWINVEKLSENEKLEWTGGNTLIGAAEKFLIAFCYKSKMSELLKK